VLWNVAGPQSVSVNYANAAGCSASVATIYEVAVGDGIVPTITGDADVCVNSGAYTYTTESGMLNYLWEVSVGGTVVSGSGTNQVEVEWFSAGAQSVNVNYTSTANCPSLGPGILHVNVNTPPSGAGPITGEPIVCEGSVGVSYAIVPVINATTYSWTLPTGASISSGAGSPNITVDFNAGSTSGAIIVNANNLCGNGAASPAFNVTVIPAPNIAFVNDVLLSDAPTGNQWYRDGVAIPGAVQQSYEPDMAGDYFATVTINACTTIESDHLWVSLTGSPTPSREGFTIYPNPTTGDIQLEWPTASTGTASVKLINTLGQLVFNQQASMNKGIGKLSVSGLSKGMYMLKVEFDKQVVTSTLIISE
jgi:hypothetical protein